jgi:hypothetical protein
MDALSNLTKPLDFSRTMTFKFLVWAALLTFLKVKSYKAILAG